MSGDGNGPAKGGGRRRIATVLTQAGRDPQAFHGFVNPPVARGSTIIFEDVEAMESRATRAYPYGLTNTPTLGALRDALDELEGAAGTVLVPSGLAALTTAILAVCDGGDRLLVPDNVYYPTRRFCMQTLKRFGVEAVFYDPLIGDGIARLMEGRHTHLLIEAPGSQTFEMPDIGALVAAAKAAGGRTLMDNTWATPLIFRPLANGIDLSIQAGTKYLGGHSDLLIGSVSATEEAWPRLSQTHRDLGVQAGPEDAWLTLRGIRTLGVRLDRQEASALHVAAWLKGRPEVARVLHPALPDDPGHALWKKHFGRASSLFGFVLAGGEAEAKRFLDGLQLFGLGYSFGGYESLAVLAELKQTRTATRWTEGPVVRLHVGLEDPADLIADLEGGFAAMTG
jgi:cysteine-S-conjugate beta-lyase